MRGEFAAAWLGLVMYPGFAAAAMPPALDVSDASSASGSFFVQRGTDVVPPFLAAARNRSRAGLAARFRPAESVQLDAEWSWMRDQMHTDEVRSGPGDIRLDVRTDVWTLGSTAFALGWGVKWPNAADGAELGTDETDVSAYGAVHQRVGPFHGSVLAGIAVLGDPVRFANQDDAALFAADASLFLMRTHWQGRVGGTLSTARNPARITGEVGAWWGCETRGGISTGAGFTPAAPGWTVRAWVGLGAGCD